MNKPVGQRVNKAADSIQQRLTSYACDLNYDDLSSDAINAARGRIIDTLGALIGGFHGEPCHIARNLAAQIPKPDKPEPNRLNCGTSETDCDGVADGNAH
jgi:2-methylcitrate dehydratase PrpD